MVRSDRTTGKWKGETENMKELIEMLRSCGERGCADCPDVEECAGPGYLMLKAAEELEKPRVSEGLDKVIAGLRCCRINEDDPCEGNCPYDGQPDCVGRLMDDALAWLQEQNRLIAELSDHIPCCDNCEGKTTLGERTDKCVYEIEGFDSVIYCAKRGIENCFGYRKRIEELEQQLKSEKDGRLELARKYREFEEETDKDIIELNRDLERCREALNAQGEYAYLGGDLISREALIEKFKEICWYSVNGHFVLSEGAANEESAYIRYTDAVRAVELAGSVDAEVVKYGRWIPADYKPHIYHKCSECGNRITVDEKTDYCGKCGAHMDEEVAE